MMFSTLPFFIPLLVALQWFLCLSEGNTPPIINLPAGMATGVVTISEATEMGSLLGALEVKDPDHGLEGQFSCIVESKFVMLTKITPNFYKLSISTALDRETLHMDKVVLTCKDQGSPPLSETIRFSIVLSDENDNIPMFTQQVYTFSIPENLAKGAFLGKVEAIDMDAGENGMVKYRLVDDHDKVSKLFSIDTDNGVITTNQVLDREQQETVELSVIASDHGEPPQLVQANVIITILDENDNSPVIETEILSINEGEPARSLVGVIVATDNDTGNNAKLRFSVVENDDAIPPFFVDANGTVSAAVKLDRESLDEYVLHVKVSDSGEPPRSNTSFITIRVKDVNDHPPWILSPREAGDDSLSNTSESISIDWYNPDEDKDVFVLKARDLDIGENGRIRYSISYINSQEVNRDSLFDIDERTGRVFLRRYIRVNDDPVQFVNFTASDSGSPPKSVYAWLNITLDVDFSTLPSPSPPRKAASTPGNGNNSAHGIVTLRENINLYLLSFILCFIIKIKFQTT